MQPDAAATAASYGAARSARRVFESIAEATALLGRTGVSAEAAARALAGNSVLRATVSKDYLSRIDAEHVLPPVEDLACPRCLGDGF